MSIIIFKFRLIKRKIVKHISQDFKKISCKILQMFVLDFARFCTRSCSCMFYVILLVRSCKKVAMQDLQDCKILASFARALADELQECLLFASRILARSWCFLQDFSTREICIIYIHFHTTNCLKIFTSSYTRYCRKIYVYCAFINMSRCSPHAMF